MFVKTTMMIFTLALHVVVGARVSSSRRQLLPSAPNAGLPACGNSSSNDSRLVFIHIYKAAGSTVRNLLREYAGGCRRSWGCLVDCDKPHLIANDEVQCALKDVVNSDRVLQSRDRDVQVRERFPTVDYVREFDVVGGHLTFGLDAIYDSRFRVRFVTMLREPVSSVISGIRYSHPQYTIDQVHQAIVDLKTKHSVYKNAVNYLASGGEESFEEAAINLASRFDLVGLVENFATSMTLLQLFVDPDLAWKGWFKQPKMNTSPGHFSTRDVVRKLSNSTLSELVRYTKDESFLYRFALRAHADTCRTIVSSSAQKASQLPCRCMLHETEDRVVRCVT